MYIEKPPYVSVVIRSYNRLQLMIELAHNCLAQNYENFEVLVIEQSSDSLRVKFQQELTSLSTDHKIRILYFGKLGPAGARNKAVANARGEILLFIDDDDIPADNNWIKNHVKNFVDPNCVAVTGREFVEGEEDPSKHNTKKNYKLCLRYTFFKMPRARTKHTMRLESVTALQGGNTSIRKDVIERVRGWDEGVDNHEENSFDFKFHRMKKTGEYYVYEPDAAIVRRLDIEGGLDRRAATVEKILHDEYVYMFGIIRRYFPLRFYMFMGIYVFLLIRRTYQFMRKNQPTFTRTKILSETLAGLLKLLSQPKRASNT